MSNARGGPSRRVTRSNSKRSPVPSEETNLRDIHDDVYNLERKYLGHPGPTQRIGVPSKSTSPVFAISRNNSNSSTSSRKEHFSPNASDSAEQVEGKLNQKHTFYQFFVKWVPTLFSGAKALSMKNPYYFIIGIFWVIYFLWVFSTVLSFLNSYYIQNAIPDNDIKALDDVSRWFIAFSYFLIDAIYPLSFVLIYFFCKTGKSPMKKIQVCFSFIYIYFFKSRFG